MRAGTLKQVITIEYDRNQAPIDVDSVGQPETDWAIFLDGVRASYEPSRGREFFAAQGRIVEAPALFRIRYTPGVVPTMRIIYNHKVWDISSVEDVMGRQREMYLYCATGLTEG
jgi:SPP1 family predicted phage head-tail adaptor